MRRKPQSTPATERKFPISDIRLGEEAGHSFIKLVGSIDVDPMAGARDRFDFGLRESFADKRAILIGDKV